MCRFLWLRMKFQFSTKMLSLNSSCCNKSIKDKTKVCLTSNCSTSIPRHALYVSSSYTIHPFSMYTKPPTTTLRIDLPPNEWITNSQQKTNQETTNTITSTTRLFRANYMRKSCQNLKHILYPGIPSNMVLSSYNWNCQSITAFR